MDYAKLILTSWLRQPVFRALWPQSATSLSPQIVAFVSGLIAEMPLAGLEDAVARLRADLVKIKRQ